VIVGDDDPRGIDDEAGAERIGLARLQVSAPVASLGVASRTAAVPEKIVEEFLERRARRQLRHRAPALAAALGFHGLRRRDVDHRINHLLRDVGDAVRTPRRGRRRDEDACGAEGSAKTDRGHHGTQAMTKGWDRTGHVRSLSKENGVGNLISTVRLNGATAQAAVPDISLP
jgi:hypothetical protein